MEPDGSPEIVAPGIRRATREDAPRISAWLDDPEVHRYLTSNFRRGGVEPGLIAAALRRPDQAWFVLEDSSGEPLGLLAFDSVDRVDGVANLWFVLGDRERAGRGVMSDAIGRLLEANPLSLHSVFAWAGEPNAASLRCMEKAGLRRVGRYEQAFRLDDGFHDRILFQKLLDDPS